MAEEPQTPYEKMLDRLDLDCAMHGCWQPIRGFVRVAPGRGDGRGADDELGLCEEHALSHGVPVRWLES